MPFSAMGGLGKVYQLFGDRLPAMLDELNHSAACRGTKFDRLLAGAYNT
jgi:hypothetical protein